MWTKMKKTLLIILPLLLIVGCGKKDGLHTEYYDDEKKKKIIVEQKRNY